MFEILIFIVGIAIFTFIAKYVLLIVGGCFGFILKYFLLFLAVVVIICGLCSIL